MKVHIADAPHTQSPTRWVARYAHLGTARIATEQHEEPISLTDATYRMIMNCQVNSDSRDLTTNGRCESAQLQPLNTKEEVKS